MGDKLKRIKLKDILSWAYEVLKNANVDSPRLSAELIISHALNISRLELLLSLNNTIDLNLYTKIVSLINQRALGKPVAYIIGKKEFYGREFFVNQSVLIPRPETETLIDTVKNIFRKEDNFLFLDIGTGSGNIAITIGCEFPNSIGIATDYSIHALFVAYKNAKIYKLTNRLLFICTDIARSIKEHSFDLVLSNPPYIGYKNFPSLSREIRCFEPYRALVGGYMGWEFYPSLISYSFKVLKKGGILIIEIDELVAKNVKKFLNNHKKWYNVQVIKDLSGKDRVLFAKRGE